MNELERSGQGRLTVAKGATETALSTIPSRISDPDWSWEGATDEVEEVDSRLAVTTLVPQGVLV